MDIPASSPEGKDWIGRQLQKLKSQGINKVIDIGCGAGTYYNYFHSSIGGSWTGVEIWEPYVNEYGLDKMYDQLVIQDAATVDYSTLGKFDVAFVGDVLEHMSKESAIKVINELSKICRFIFVSIPIVYYPSDEYEYNPYLRHVKPDWSDNEVVESFANIVDKQLGKEVGTYLITKEDISIAKKKFYFLIGLPRSGSTVLASLLRQNQNVYVSTTSPMLDQLVANQNIYKYELQTTKANFIQEQLDNVTLRMIQGMWEHVPQEIIIDNNRGWGKNLPSVEILFKERIKCIACYRDIPSIMASWLTLIRKNPSNHVDLDLQNRGLEITDKNRMMLMWDEMVRDCVEALVQAVIDRPDDVLLVNYDDLMLNPVIELEKINKVIGTDLLYDLDNISDVLYQADEEAWGLAGMHSVRPKLSKISRNPKEILGEDLFEMFEGFNKQFIARIGEINGK